MVFYKIFIIYICLFNVIYALKLNINKNNVNTSQLLKIHSLNNNLDSRQYSLRALINLPLQKSETTLYSINLNIGEPKQNFSLILDSGSSYVWVYNKICNTCKSLNKFIPENSKTFIQTKEYINLNYLSGNAKGNLCKDNLYINQKINILSFQFLLVYESNIIFKIDGIIGLSKGSFNKKYSFLNQLKERNIIKNKIILYDLFNKSFYIDEIPQFYLEQKTVSCKNKDDNSNFWKCDINSIKVNNISIIMETEIIFDSGSNGVIFPKKYKDYLKNIIKNNKFFEENKCEFQYFEDEQIYELICNETLKYNDTNTNEYFFEFYFDKEQKNSFGIKLKDLLCEDGKSFYLFILDRKKEIILGSPFFEKYPVLFNLDDNIINIFGGGNDFYKYNKNSSYQIGNLKLILIIIICLLLILILARIQCIYRRRKSYNKLEFLM